jgi:broad specificity phosphatase PhoE
MLFAHASAESGHAAILRALDAQPLLALDMRWAKQRAAAAIRCCGWRARCMRAWRRLPKRGNKWAEPVLLGFLRHGEVAGPAHVYRGRSDAPLTPRGREQMHAALAAMPAWGAVVSSPARRCLDFARAVAAERGIACRVDADWHELDFGAWEGLRPDKPQRAMRLRMRRSCAIRAMPAARRRNAGRAGCAGGTALTARRDRARAHARRHPRRRDARGAGAGAGADRPLPCAGGADPRLQLRRVVAGRGTAAVDGLAMRGLILALGF